MEELLARAGELAATAAAYINRPAFISQAVAIGVLFALAWTLARRAEPKLEEQARRIRGMPGLLRIVAALLRRLVWIFFVLALTVAFVLARSIGWPDTTSLLEVALLLALAWLVISVVSQVLRSRLVGRAFAVVAWLYVAAQILGITDEIAAVLDGIGFQVGGARLSLLRLLNAFVLFAIGVWAALGVSRFLDDRMRRAAELTPSLQILIGKILRVTLIAIAAWVALAGGLDLDLTVFAVFAGALGVGIGFGLQKVVSNFISGVVILLDRSIKPGDTISLGETFGWVQQLRARFVSVITRDGREYLIPNEDFITHEVINWSYTDDLVRLDVNFGVSYDADPHRVQKLAIEAARGVPRVVENKEPVCWLTAFGDSSLDFLLRFWIRDPQNGLTNIRGTVLLALWDKLKENGISIPYPHREVILKTPVTLRNAP